MKNNTQPQTATELVGKSWLYEGNIYDVKEINGKGLHIIAEPSGIRFNTEDDLNYFLSKVKPAGSIRTPMIVADANGHNVVDKLLAGLLDDFDKMGKDKEYVHQAKQRSNHVNTMMNVIKTQVMLEKHNK